MTLSLVLSFCGLVLLCTLALLWSRWPAWLKGMLLAGVTVFYFYADGLAHQMWGWPSADPLPERFVLLATVVDEPTTKSPGALFLWVNQLDNGKPTLEPRAYRLPYTKDLHAQLNEGMKRVRQGVSQMGVAEPKKGSNKGLSWLRAANQEQVVKIRDLPVPQLPEK